MCTEYLPDVKSDPDEPGSGKESGERFPPRELLQHTFAVLKCRTAEETLAQPGVNSSSKIEGGKSGSDSSDEQLNPLPTHKS